MDRTDEVSSKHCFEVADRTDAQNTVLRLQIELTKSVYPWQADADVV
ncbi:hypothetical protein [Streptococcus pneumoniae]|nr:hypothetical protein [Streptococcus pneumoniae]